MERLVDESVNLGLSYQRWNTILSIDIRNLGEESQESVREFHFGIEKILLSQIALRAGWFNNARGNQVYSWGVGLLNGNLFMRTERKFAHENFFINYAFVYENTAMEDLKQHFLSLNIRL